MGPAPGGATLVGMRIIAGSLKGLQLKGPRGRGTRPTSDLLREVLFQMMEGIAPSWSRVLDLFAGTGALGIEALSRGAEHVDFVESNTGACATIRENLGLARAANQSHVYCCTVQRALSILPGEYDIILADPPYGLANLESLLTQIAMSAWVGPETVLALEHSSHVQIPPQVGPLRLIKSRQHGDSCLAFFAVGSNWSEL
ncbi:MAG: 16S rRNA (guanine(966)-N(2))-methyltransferase RsmD [Chloroflexota bacterium]|nr:MAG: 16S rRNA (guanine(966)-N(2))-methyltransferase RsmD [Chloroflexota bacterium]